MTEDEMRFELLGLMPVELSGGMCDRLVALLLPRVAEIVKAEVALAMRKASRVIEGLVTEYPIESTAVQAGIWGDFDQWSMAYAEGLADVDLTDE